MSVQMRFSGGSRNAPVDVAHAIRALAGCEPPAPLSVAAGTLILTLCDAETNVHLAGEADTDAVREWLTFHTGARMVAAEEADFALGTWDVLGPLDTYRIGTLEYPDHSATLIVECKRLEQNGAVLSGPGIRDTAQLSLPDAAALQSNAPLYPLGCDFFLTCGEAVAALPRSTQIRSEG
ncbi:phosphonate C-P lyase system protein PhnH [uncultured Ruegeria sp.]|uniref:phosphonate C-P lyase system protein PhnH n=1 Tax=uncultured Ruegeria sp. TaxID=259304 RepID=UPI0026394C0D|nr:phosphonate C-P lyase system protein PhnH [uncultured Ruegeria sp.]